MKLKDNPTVASSSLRQFGTVASESPAIARRLPLKAISPDLSSAPGRFDMTPVDLTPDQALKRLIEGNRRFVNRTTRNPNQSLARLTEIVDQQKPFAAILGCSDSRVPLEIIFDQGLGDIFAIRVAGNVVTPAEMGSIEYGTAVLEAKVLLVLGHSSCGAVSATLKGGHLFGQIGSLVDAIQPAVARSKEQSGNALENAIKANVFLQMEQLLASSVISRMVNEGQLKLVGGYYALDSGEVSILSVYPCQPPKNAPKPDVTSIKVREKLNVSTIKYIDCVSNPSSIKAVGQLGWSARAGTPSQLPNRPPNRSIVVRNG